MDSIKIKIKTAFDAASSSYDDFSEVQKQSADFLVNKLLNFDDSFYPKTILDLGTGTGFIPDMLVHHYPNGLYMLNDIAPKMIGAVKKKFSAYDNFKFSVADMEEANFENYDLIISNLAFQWANDLIGVIEKFYKKSKILAFSCLLDGTFCEWEAILKYHGLIGSLKKYPLATDLVSLCNQRGLNEIHFQTKNFQLQFSDIMSFINYLKNLGAGRTNTVISSSTLKSLIKADKRPFTITYKIFFAIIKGK